ncbi:hypothetical protein BX616_009233, partial [Lobosporangium transversale]
RLIRLGSGPPSPPPGPRNSLKGGHCSSSREPLASGPYFDPSAFGDFAPIELESRPSRRSPLQQDQDQDQDQDQVLSRPDNTS